MSDFETELAEKLSTPRGRNWMRRQIEEAKNLQAAQSEQWKVVQELTKKTHFDLRIAIDAAEVAAEYDLASVVWLDTLNKAMDLKGRTTKEEAARLSLIRISYLENARGVYYNLETKTMAYFNRVKGRLEEISACSGEYRDPWKPSTDMTLVEQFKGLK